MERDKIMHWDNTHIICQSGGVPSALLGSRVRRLSRPAPRKPIMGRFGDSEGPREEVPCRFRNSSSFSLSLSLRLRRLNAAI